MVTFAEVVSEERVPPTIDVVRPQREPNIAPAERIALGVIGGLLVSNAIYKPTLPRLVLGAIGGALIYRSAMGYCPAYESLGINHARGRMATPHDYFRTGIHAEVVSIIDRPIHELYAYWRNFENLPRFMRHLEAVRKIDEKRSHWVARGPGGLSVEWDAEIINEAPNRLIAWHSLTGADVDNTGSVLFAPALGGRGTEIRVEIQYIPPGGKLGKGIAWLFGEEPHRQLEEDLRYFKQFMETGEIPTA